MLRFDCSQPQVMAIVNITPDSFYARSRQVEREAVVRRIREAVEQGANLLDIGGCSSRPGAAPIDEAEEWRRVSMGLEEARRLAPHIPLSVDTFRSGIVQRAVERFGEVVVNDISAGEQDPEMIPTVARLGLSFVAMHMRGVPTTMQQMTSYERDIASEVVTYFERRVSEFLAAGVRREQIILDPGLGFAKSVEQNYELLAGLHRLCGLGLPVLVGLSRKSMIYRVLNTTPDEALAGSVALGWEALRQGATILRVHDVCEAVDSVRLFRAFQQNSI